MKEREPRYRVVLPARIRWDGPWMSASVRNVSAHGLQLKAAEVPPRGTYVELLVGAETIAARTIWSDDGTCGVRSRNPVNFDQLREPQSRAARVAADRSFGTKAPRPDHIAEYRRSSDHSRASSYALQYLTALCVALLVAGSIGWEVYQTLSAPMTIITGAMSVHN